MNTGTRRERENYLLMLFTSLLQYACAFILSFKYTGERVIYDSLVNALSQYTLIELFGILLSVKQYSKKGSQQKTPRWNPSGNRSV